MKLYKHHLHLYKSIFLLAISVYLFSCKKENGSETNASRNLLRSISYTNALGTSVDTFIYDSQWRLITFGKVNGPINIMEYNSSGRLIKEDFLSDTRAIHHSATFEYNSQNQIIRKVMSSTVQPFISDYGYEYDTEGKVIRQKIYYRQTDSVLSVYTNTFINNNLYEQDIKALDNTGNSGKIIFKYDNSPNPYHLLTNIFFVGEAFYPSSNNQTEFKTWWGRSFYWQYTYLKNGYPAKATLKETYNQTTGLTTQVVYNYW